ncbi:MAG: riboflavin kinase [Dehalococcoidia bacterium]|nr:riboflavin kinase [Dehalococcoidia bacterium]
MAARAPHDRHADRRCAARSRRPGDAPRPPGAARLPAAVSWGRRPTFGGGTLRLEVHLVGFSGDLYGRELDVAFLARIRDERRFERVEELVREMARDVEAVRSLVGDVPEL